MPRMLGYRLARESTAGILLLTRQEGAELAGSDSIVLRFDFATVGLMARRSQPELDSLMASQQAPALGRKLRSEPPEEF